MERVSWQAALSEAEISLATEAGHVIQLFESIHTKRCILICSCGDARDLVLLQGALHSIRCHLARQGVLPKEEAFRCATPSVKNYAKSLRKRARKRIPEIVKMRGENCYWCGLDITELQRSVEHIIPISEGGTNDLGNLALAHKKCNNGRSRPEKPAARRRRISTEEAWALVLKESTQHLLSPPELGVGIQGVQVAHSFAGQG